MSSITAPASDRGYCRAVEDGMDGYVEHTSSCQWHGNPAASSSACIRPGQNGPAIKARRDAAADELRFTPPEYRSPRREPAPVIALPGARSVVVALRGRPKGSGGAWSTWQEFWVEPTGSFLQQAAARMNPQPRYLSTDEAEAVVSEFSARVPHYEFKFVVARSQVVETALA